MNVNQLAIVLVQMKSRKKRIYIPTFNKLAINVGKKGKKKFRATFTIEEQKKKTGCVWKRGRVRGKKEKERGKERKRP